VIFISDPPVTFGKFDARKVETGRTRVLTISVACRTIIAGTGRLPIFSTWVAPVTSTLRARAPFSSSRAKVKPPRRETRICHEAPKLTSRQKRITAEKAGAGPLCNDTTRQRRQRPVYLGTDQRTDIVGCLKCAKNRSRAAVTRSPRRQQRVSWLVPLLLTLSQSSDLLPIRTWSAAKRASRPPFYRLEFSRRKCRPDDRHP
jgi:hypothetical protein